MPSGVVLPLCLMAVGASGCFSGSWDYEALEAVCAGPELNLGLGRRQLLESSLLHLKEDRYSLHQLVRDYVAAEMPLEDEAEEGLRLKHAQHYLEVDEQADEKLGGEEIEEGLGFLSEPNHSCYPH